MKRNVLLIPVCIVLFFLLSCKDEETVWIGCPFEPYIDLQWVDPEDGTDVEMELYHPPYGGAYKIHIPKRVSEYNFIATNVDSLALTGIQVVVTDDRSIIYGPDPDAGIWSTKDRRTYKSQWMNVYVTKLSETQEHIKIVVKEPETTEYPAYISFGYEDYALNGLEYHTTSNGLMIRFDR